MDKNILQNEMLLETYLYQNTPFELIQRQNSIWTGALSYAENVTDEPDIESIRNRYQKLTDVPKKNLLNPGWDACISIDYWQNGKSPRGMFFGEEVSDKTQDTCFDLFEMPSSLYLRVCATPEAVKNLLKKDSCDGLWEFFDSIKQVMELYGYENNDNGAQEIEMYGHCVGAYYAYVPVKQKGK